MMSEDQRHLLTRLNNTIERSLNTIQEETEKIKNRQDYLMMRLKQMDAENMSIRDAPGSTGHCPKCKRSNLEMKITDRGEDFYYEYSQCRVCGHQIPPKTLPKKRIVEALEA